MAMEFLFDKTVGEPAFALKPSIRELLDELITYASEPRFAKKLEEARAYYFFKAGKINEDDHDFIQRMNTILEWFIFDYRPDGIGTHSIFDQYMSEKRPGLSSEQLIRRIAVSNHVHSLFLVKSCAAGVAKLKDLAAKRQYIVTDDDRLEKGDILETRVIHLDKGCFLSYTHCLHSKEAKKAIVAEMKRWKGKALSEEFFFKLQNMQLKWRRFRQISINDIYRM
jgi:hypothetical protein